MEIRALIFDFDGLILDTETPEIEVWKEIYAEHGQAYPMDLWSQIIGGWGNTDFDPAAELQRLAGRPLDVPGLRERHRQASEALILNSPVMPGVQDVLAGAQRLGLRCVIGSSSERGWVEPHLRRLGLINYFERLITGDQVPKGRTKPHPDVFLKALQVLELPPNEVLVLEDSPNGIKAAHSAGLRVVGVPNSVTAPLKLDADLMLASLADMSLEEILKRVEHIEAKGKEPQARSRPANAQA